MALLLLLLLLYAIVFVIKGEQLADYASWFHQFMLLLMADEFKIAIILSTQLCHLPRRVILCLNVFGIWKWQPKEWNRLVSGYYVMLAINWAENRFFGIVQ
jgi:hypothetical protein